MTQEINKRTMVQLAAKMGTPITEKQGEIALLKFHNIKVVDLLPEMMVMIRSLLSEKEFSYRRKPITIIKSGLLISFQNVFNGRNEDRGVMCPATNWDRERAHVRIIPLHLDSEVKFSKQVHIEQITILVETAYLKQFLGTEQTKFSYLFNLEKTFWIDEFMSPEIAALVDEVVNSSAAVSLPDFYYRLKSLELLYFLFRNLSQRESISHLHMTTRDIEAIYRVRNAIAASLDKALPAKELAKLSGMNELKLRKLFTQVFGKGLYPYFQHLRMQEAARLLKEERLSVSETGYYVGFTNLSHFGRLFEEHMGAKPKKWISKT
ncbi:helix-turn-helix domain-containing protein [Pedobacter endophyticus]|uniref:Helix-turn-helix domain-containing protein n=1 Tax=Pedobacter endophyticus TaxID=2789740 RepID=A0A7U3SPV9_9SPHI|nr:AraC family transcriptional regulator [Pedobacter endophyticus]QPH38933.1 helix-turn-helix domain-containing protein [Pedobacter endophyticus]